MTTKHLHPVRTVRVGGWRAQIDELLAPVVEAIWQLGLETRMSCQDLGEQESGWARVLPHMEEWVQARRGRAYIDFPITSGLAFLTAVAQAGPRDAFYVRMTHVAAPDAWEVAARPVDDATRHEFMESQFRLRLLRVVFPRSDLKALHDRLMRYRAGRLTPPAPADWSTVGRTPRSGVRDAVRQLVDLGPLPAEDDIETPELSERDRLLRAVTRPVTDAEARLLVKCFGPDDCYGLAWELVRLIDSAPTFVVARQPPPDANPWLTRLWWGYRNSLED